MLNELQVHRVKFKSELLHESCDKAHMLDSYRTRGAASQLHVWSVDPVGTAMLRGTVSWNLGFDVGAGVLAKTRSFGPM